MTSAPLHSRTALIAIGVAGLGAWAYSEWRARRGLPGWPPTQLRVSAGNCAERRFASLNVSLMALYALAASLAKLSQLRALELNGQDFWLFEDMLRQILAGEWMVTRFAPQAVGFVQHGAVHPMLSWGLLAPLAALIGPTLAALLYGPLTLASAGGMIAVIARPRWGAPSALALAAAFFASTQAGRILMYDTHPETAYPLATLVWAWAAGWGDGRLRPAPLLLAAAVLMGIKEDAFSVFFPLLVATLLTRQTLAREKTWLAASAVVALAVMGLQFHAVHQWMTQAWGPSTSHGSAVTIPHGAELVGQRHWEGPGSAWAIASDLIAQRGGITGVLSGWGSFLVSRPWLSLLALAPWVIAQPAFWLSVLPLTVLYSVLPDPGKFINYYAAPLLGIFWLAVTRLRVRGDQSTQRSRHRRAALWSLSLGLVLGGSGLDYYRQTPEIREIREETRALAHCLGPHTRGVVSSRLLDLVARETVHSDRAPTRLEDADYYLFAPTLASYELPPDASDALRARLVSDPKWNRLGKNCQTTDKDSLSSVLLFVRKE